MHTVFCHHQEIKVEQKVHPFTLLARAKELRVRVVLQAEHGDELD